MCNMWLMNSCLESLCSVHFVAIDALDSCKLVAQSDFECIDTNDCCDADC